MEIRISTDRAEIDVDLVHDFLSRESYWCPGIPREVVERAIAGSLCFSVFRDDSQVGFARVVTDGATFAYLADVFIVSEQRGRGLSKQLMEHILAHPQLQGLRRFCLATADAHALYGQFGFTPLARPERYMERYQPDAYRQQD